MIYLVTENSDTDKNGWIVDAETDECAKQYVRMRMMEEFFFVKHLTTDLVAANPEKESEKLLSDFLNTKKRMLGLKAEKMRSDVYGVHVLKQVKVY